MTSIDEALSKAYARQGLPTTRRRSGGPHIRASRVSVAPTSSTPAPPITLTTAAVLTSPLGIVTADVPSVSSTTSQYMTTLSLPSSTSARVEFRFQEAVSDGIVRSDGQHAIAPAMKHWSAHLSPDAMQPVHNAVDAPMSPEVAAKPLLSATGTSLPESVRDSAGGECFRYEVLTNDPLLNKWQPVDDLVNVRGVVHESGLNVTSRNETPAATIQTKSMSSLAMSETSPQAATERDVTFHSTEGDESEHSGAVRFKAAWEVDNFGFPDTCTKAVPVLQDNIRLAVASLISACSVERRVISVGSWLRGEGRTTVSILLAQALALAHQRVVLIDADFENPQVADQLGLSIDGGWDPRAIDQIDLRENCVYSLDDQFTLLPLHLRGGSDEVKDRESLVGLVNHLRGHFDLILIDHGPGSAALSHPGLAGRSVKLVVRDMRETSAESLDRLISRLQQQDDAPIFVIENFAEWPNSTARTAPPSDDLTR